MLRNYFKIAIAVLKRRKFFTFISLFGISFTLTILIVLTAFVDHLVSPAYPDTQRDRSLYVFMVRQLDTKNNGQRSGPASFYFMDHFVGSLKTPERLAISSIFASTNTYVNNKKLVIDVKYTNQAYWDVLQYQFVEGKPYSEQQIANAEKVAVISEDTRKRYFGNVPAVGKIIETDNVKYRVCGVVKSVPITRVFAYADMYLPYTVSKRDYRDKSYNGMYTGILLARNKSDLLKMKEEYKQMMAKIPPPEEGGFDKIESSADSYVENIARNLISRGSESGLTILYAGVTIFILFFMLLPTLNLVNINISRIMERSSEIGVRKAFGASSTVLVYQFLVENLILTFLGGAIGIVLSFIVLNVINNAELIPNADLEMNLTVIFFSILACIVFGIFSGVYPAWRMSRLQVVTALKA
jgi:putative ABC transport system permease protein